jgi:hypothetical protein
MSTTLHFYEQKFKHVHKSENEEHKTLVCYLQVMNFLGKLDSSPIY